MSIKNTNDPRVKRTRQLIQDAFVALVGEKGFENVTVQHIAERAPVNRATFYSHYHDKYDLLDKSIEEMLEKLTKVIKQKNRNKEDFQLTFDSPHPSFLALFEHIAENANFYNVMLGDKAAGNYTYKMMKAIQTHLTLSLSISQPNDEKLMVPRDILISYVTGCPPRHDYVMAKKRNDIYPAFYGHAINSFNHFRGSYCSWIRTAF